MAFPSEQDFLDAVLLNDFSRISQYFDVNVFTKNGFHSIHMIAMHFNPKACQSMLNILNILLTHNTDLVDLKTRKNANEQHTPLHFAITFNNLPVAKILLSHGADSNKKQLDGKTPMHDAVLLNNFDAMKLLVQHNGIITAVDNDNNSVLHDAIEGIISSENEEWNILELLLLLNAPLHKNAHGRTPQDIFYNIHCDEKCIKDDGKDKLCVYCQYYLEKWDSIYSSVQESTDSVRISRKKWLMITAEDPQCILCKYGIGFPIREE